MASPLEAIPSEVLERIAIYAASSSTFDWPVEVCYLMQSRSLYNALNIWSAPHVYAEIFASKFDISAPNRRYRHTSSFRAAELVNRYRLLKRCRRRDVSPMNLMQDLLTALWMFLESDGLNERQLRIVDFPSYIIQVARARLKGMTAPIEARRDGQASSLGHIIVWLLCFALRRDEILKMSQSVRDELYGSIFPYIYYSSHTISPVPACLKCSQTATGCNCIGEVDGSKPAGISLQHCSFNSSFQPSTYYRRHLTVDIPNSSAAAINLAIVILESKPPSVPFHLLGNPVQVAGPTLDDFLSFKHYSTPLFADSCCHTSRSMSHDLEFRHQLRQAGLDRSHPAVKYSLGTMGGVWEGRYALKIGASGEDDEFHTFQRPIQCALAEYVSDDSGHDDIIGFEHLSFSGVLFDQDRSELFLRGHRYRKYSGRMETGRHASQLPEFHHIVLYGETLDDHDRAWNAFKFLGAVYEDGRVVLYRSPKHSDEGDVFALEGRLRFGQVFVGRWRMSAAPNDTHGIFSMTKR